MPTAISRAIALLVTLTALLLSTGSASGQCLNPNGSFTYGMANWKQSDWAGGNVRVTDKGDREYALEVNRSVGEQFVTVPGGGQFELSLDIYGNEKWEKGKRTGIRVVAYDAAWSEVWSQTLLEARMPKRWTRRTFGFEAPAETVHLIYFLSCREEKSYFDQVCFRRTGSEQSEDCGAANHSFDAGWGPWHYNGKWQGTEVGVGIHAEAGVTFARAENSWVATQPVAAIASEEYTVTYRMRAYGTPGKTAWVAAKYFRPSPVDGSDELVREEPLYREPLGPEWKTYTAKAIMPASATKLQIVVADGTGGFELDYVCFRPTAANRKACFSGAGEPAYWGDYDEYKKEKGRDNTFEVEDRLATHDFDVEAGKVYRVEMQFFGANDTDKPSRFEIAWFDAAGAQLSVSTLAQRTYPKQWRRFSESGTAPAGAERAQLRVGNPDAKVYFREVCISEVGEPGAASSISGMLFSDDDSDGRWDVSEGALGGSQLLLYRDDGNGEANPDRDVPVASILSSALPAPYSFAELPAGDYFVVAYLLPTKYISQYKQAGVPVDRQSKFQSRTYGGQSAAISDLISLDGANNAAAINLGQRPSLRAAVTGYVWSDANDNGYRDEPLSTGINGVRLRTYRESDGALLATTLTRDDPAGNPGYYLFNYVQATDVRVVVDVPSGVALTPYQTQYNDMRVDPASGRSAILSLQPDLTVANTSVGMRLSGTEVCDNGIDDDGDGRTDLADSDCSTCVRQDEVLCGEPYRHFISPVHMMIDPADTSLTGPAFLIVTTDADSVEVRGSTPDGAFAFRRMARRTEELRIPIPKQYMQLQTANAVRNDRGLILESAEPINAVFFINGHFNKALVTMKGQQALGNRFFAGSQTVQRDCRTMPGANPDGAPVLSRGEAHFVSVMATEDDTEVTFAWRDTIITYEGLTGGTHTVRLDRGETYLVRDAFTNQTVSGTRITSDKAITVLSGSGHTRICDEWGQDAGIDQLVPECYVGNEYVAVKHKGFDRQHYVVVVPTQDNTEIRLNGTVVATRDALDYEQIMLPGVEGDPHLITADAPIYVYHVSGISQNQEVGMALAASFGECRGNRYLTFAAGASKLDVQRSLNVVVRGDVAASLKLNGTQTLPGTPMTLSQVPGRPDFYSIVVPGDNLLEVNTLEADGYFQAAMLIGIDNKSGTFGYLTSFAQGIEVTDPTTGRPSSRYELPMVCGGATVEHTLEVSSCETGVRIIEQDNDSNVGTVTITGDLSFRYEANPAAYQEDRIQLRLRDDNGLETSVCISTWVCGSSVPMQGLPASQYLGCGESIPSSSPYVASENCPVELPIPFRDTTIAGDCPGNYQVIRTWSKANECGTVIEASRTFTYEDTAAPSIDGDRADVTVCGGAVAPLPTLSTSDGCGGATLSTPRLTRVDIPGSSAYEVIREWTATDACSNTATATQRVLHVEVPTLEAPLRVTPATCGLPDGTLTIDFADDSRRTHVEFAIDGVWKGSVADDLGAVTYGGLAPGTYSVQARWGGGQRCPVNLGSVTVAATPCGSVGGIVFEDINYGGGRGRDFNAANASAVASGWSDREVAVPGARVEAYAASGAFVSATVTDATGRYRFDDLTPGDYDIRVVSASVKSRRAQTPASSRPGGTLAPLAVPTYRRAGGTSVTDEVGGANPDRADAGSNTTSASLSSFSHVQAVSRVNVGASSAAEADFGFSFSVVTNTNDSGQGSLRQWVHNANGLANDRLDLDDAPVDGAQDVKPAGRDVSVFMLGGVGAASAKTITLAEALPRLVDPASTLSGYTQFGAARGAIGARSLRVTLRGRHIEPEKMDLVLIGGNDITVEGLSVTRGRAAIRVIASSCTGLRVQGNYVGVGVDGVTGAGLSPDVLYADASFTGLASSGASIQNASASFIGTDGDGVDDELEGNLFAYCYEGVMLRYTSDVLVAGNYAGLDASGGAAAANRFSGIHLRDTRGRNVVGLDDELPNLTPANARNVLSGNGNDGVRLTTADDQVVAGNYIGTDVAGMAVLANGGYGVGFNGATSRNVIGTDGDGLRDAEERNLLCGSGGGLRFSTQGSGADNVVAGNYVGMGADGRTPVPNRVNGLNLEGPHTRTRVGTNADGLSDTEERNVISGNREDGIRINNMDDWLLAGNYIGLAADGVTKRGNGKRGVFIDQTVENGCVGYRPGMAIPAAAANVFTDNEDSGLAFSSTGLGTRVSRNSFYDNEVLGIDLGYNLVTPNDGTTTASAPNGYLDFPVLTSARLRGDVLTVRGYAPAGVEVEVFIADAGPSPSPLPSGYTSSFGEGAVYVGTFVEGSGADAEPSTGVYTDDGTGSTVPKTAARFEATITVAPGVRALMTDATQLTATSTTAIGTSEFGGRAAMTFVEICDNGIDDDGDGATDCDDDNCPKPNVVRRVEQR